MCRSLGGDSSSRTFRSSQGSVRAESEVADCTPTRLTGRSQNHPPRTMARATAMEAATDKATETSRRTTSCTTRTGNTCAHRGPSHPPEPPPHMHTHARQTAPPPSPPDPAEDTARRVGHMRGSGSGRWNRDAARWQRHSTPEHPSRATRFGPGSAWAVACPFPDCRMLGLLVTVGPPGCWNSKGGEFEAHRLDDNFHAAAFTRSTPDVGAIRCVSGVTKSALTPDCSTRSTLTPDCPLTPDCLSR